jgi:hypothetical protein
MTSIEVAGEHLPVRSELGAAVAEAWRRLALPGTWWTGEDRLAIAAEVRRAATCELCRQRKAALSPAQVQGGHDSESKLSPAAVEAIHRLSTDAGRITERWVRQLVESGLAEERYVEIIGVVACVTALDTFDRALGRPMYPLPTPIKGEPTRRRPSGAARDLAWVATLAPEAVSSADPNPYPAHGDKNIHRALSLVPAEVFNFFDLDVELYLKDHEIRDFSREYRAISHRQIELMAGRASALNRCYY